MQTNETTLHSIKDITTRITYGFTKPMIHLETGIPIITGKNVLDGRIDFNNVHYADINEFNELTENANPRKVIF